MERKAAADAAGPTDVTVRTVFLMKLFGCIRVVCEPLPLQLEDHQSPGEVWVFTIKSDVSQLRDSTRRISLKETEHSSVLLQEFRLSVTKLHQTKNRNHRILSDKKSDTGSYVF